VESRNRSHQRLQDEAERHRSTGPIENILPEPIVNIGRKSVHQQGKRDQSGGRRHGDAR
jgi:hypothetical protein